MNSVALWTRSGWKASIIWSMVRQAGAASRASEYPGNGVLGIVIRCANRPESRAGPKGSSATGG
jgi:hypothetical protein